jgi:hypothetical protein
LILIATLIAAAIGFGHHNPRQISGHVPLNERQVLMEFFAATGGERWTKHDGWGTSRPECDWYGVECGFIEGDLNRLFVSALSLEQFFLGLLADASWERETRKPKCDFQK